MPDLYAQCPCGSGKKFKWCCQPIYPGIQHALEQQAAGQHETALRTIEQVITDHPSNPEAWGQKARLLYSNEKSEEAEVALEQAFAINPNYPFGLLLRATMRFEEREYVGALLLARRAADAYDPQARDALAQIYYMIFDCEMRRNCPVAGRAALEQVMHLQPDAENLPENFEAIFGPAGRLPICARKRYELRKASPARREAWSRTLGQVAARLSDLARGFDALTKEDPGDVPAWFNLGVARAWLGENATALEALDHYIENETDERAAAEAGMLCEVLRCSHGLEEQSDYCEYSAVMQLREAEPINQMLRGWMDARRLVPLPTEQEGVFTALILELSATGIITTGRPVAEFGRMSAYLTIIGNLFRISGPLQEPFDRLRNEVRQTLRLNLGDLQTRSGPLGFHDVVTEAVAFPIGQENNEQTGERVIEHAARYYEDTWIHHPRKSLNNIAPVDAAGSARLRKKLLGVIGFIEDCARKGMIAGYEFDRLRRRLGLSGQATATAATDTAAPADLSSANAAELGALKADALTDEQLEQAYQAAHRLDAQELAANFARTLLNRPVPAARPDRYPWYLYLVQKGIRNEEYDAALDDVNDGERVDCEHNGGKRRNDYELLRARVHAKRGDVAQAEGVFQGVIDRTPRNFEVRGQAAKTMLDLKEATKALKFAQDGVKAAKEANNRDAEQMLLELVEAAKKAGG